MNRFQGFAALGALLLALSTTAGADPASGGDGTPDAAKIRMQWGTKIPLRDGVHLNATVYLPKDLPKPAPCIFTLTPYTDQNYHDRGVYFAAHGLPFLTVDVRGRGNSEGEFRPMINEAKDGYDVVEWLARQPYCNGKVSMWGGSYAGYDQWATAKELPPHLATFVPVAAAHPGVDFPMSGNIFAPYDMQWLTYTSGHTLQAKLFEDGAFWTARNREWFESGVPFSHFDQVAGNPSPTFHEWLRHPYVDAYWDAYAPTPQQYAAINVPVLTITGSYDGDQPGALSFYREHLQYASAAARAQHYLIIGPWDHAGTRTPKIEFGGLKFGPESLVDLPKLHLEWYAWTMQGGPKPDFLKQAVAYYVMGAERWRYADSLEAVTSRSEAWYLDSHGTADDVFGSGMLRRETPGTGTPDRYLGDPRDISGARIEASEAAGGYTDQRGVYASTGKQLVYHTEPFAQDTEISGFFRLAAWISIDQPDTDITVAVYEVGVDGSSVFLGGDAIRARYRESLRKPKLVQTREALRYDFSHFTFVSRQVRRDSRLRLVIGPVNSIGSEKNYNAGGVVAEESMADARVVHVALLHDKAHPSALYVPLGRPDQP